MCNGDLVAVPHDWLSLYLPTLISILSASHASWSSVRLLCPPQAMLLLAGSCKRCIELLAHGEAHVWCTAYHLNSCLVHSH